MSEPPGLSAVDVQAVRMARLTVEQADDGPFHDAPQVRVLRDLLTAYDVLAGRLAWLSAQFGELRTDYLALHDEVRRTMNGDQA